MDYENKYYKYKMKYLQLKEELMKQGYDMDNFMMGEGKNSVNKVTIYDLIEIAAKINNCDDLSKPGKKIKCPNPRVREDGHKYTQFKELKRRVKILFEDQLNATNPILNKSTMNTLVLLNVFCVVRLPKIKEYYNVNPKQFTGGKKSPIYLKIMEKAKKDRFSAIGTDITHKGGFEMLLK